MENDKILMRRALTQAFAEKFDEELAACDVTAACSEVHTQRMAALIGRVSRSAHRKSFKKWLVAGLVAAILLIATITVGAYYKEIKAFCERIYAEYIHLTFVDEGENPDEFTTYTLGFVPEGYSLESQDSTSKSVYYRWKNEDGEYLVFEQFALSVFDANIDNEEGASVIRQYGKYEVYYRSHETGICTYIWNDGEYVCILDSSRELPEEHLENIMNGIVTIE